ncbi:lytic transglycosylase catalytic, partial [gut metagenome]
DLRQANRVSGSNIRVGQRLLIPVSGQVYDKTEAGQTYTVAAGDTLSKIANRYGVSVTRIMRANRMTRHTLKVGQRLEIPSGVRAPVVKHATASSSASTGIHRVRKGESLYEIAKRYGVSLKNLKESNGLRGNSLRVGQKLVIPATAKSQPRRSDSEVKTDSPQNEVATTFYRVRRGDTLSSIAHRYRTSVQKLKQLNGLRRNTLRVGQTLRVS